MERTLPLNMLEPLPKRVRALSELDPETVERYADIYRDPAARKCMDKPVVFCEPGCERYVIADGEHRAEGARRAELDALTVDLREGDHHDALAFALGCNARHGLPRRKLDVWNAFCLLMDDPVLCSRFRTDQEKADALCASRRSVVQYKADYRDCGEWQHMLPAERWKRLNARRRKERDETTEYSEPDQPASDVELPTPKRAHKPRSKREKLTAAQKKAAKHARESVRQQQLDAANRKTFEQGLQAVLDIPLDGAERARRWRDLGEAKVRLVRDVCDEFLREREKARAS